MLLGKGEQVRQLPKIWSTKPIFLGEVFDCIISLKVVVKSSLRLTRLRHIVICLQMYGVKRICTWSGSVYCLFMDPQGKLDSVWELWARTNVCTQMPGPLSYSYSCFLTIAI